MSKANAMKSFRIMMVISARFFCAHRGCVANGDHAKSPPCGAVIRRIVQKARKVAEKLQGLTMCIDGGSLGTNIGVQGPVRFRARTALEGRLNVSERSAMVKAMMTKELRLDRQTPVSAVSARGAAAQSAAIWIIGGLAIVGAVVLASVLALVFAATAAIAMVLTLLLMAAAILTQKHSRLKPVRADATGMKMVVNARKVGHSWVAYGWDEDA